MFSNLKELRRPDFACLVVGPPVRRNLHEDSPEYTIIPSCILGYYEERQVNIKRANIMSK